MGAETRGKMVDVCTMEVQSSSYAAGLSSLNQQIGFYRGMTVACLVSLAIEISLMVGWHTHLPGQLWLPLFVASLVLFVYRYRRFWRWYGDYVLRTVRLLPKTET